MSACQTIGIIFKWIINLKLSQSRSCIWSVDKMYTIFLLVAITATLFLGTVQQCCIPSQLETYFDYLSFVPEGQGGSTVGVSTCVFLKLFTTLTFLTIFFYRVI